ncbi:ABC transporter permease [Roseivirga sp. 4D4]|uniref:ABC transporter permease n=1 Tax=Roseivirga sp. 4D4 TaxID=1889784 RepID=UPI000AB8F06D|nr:ABC transporter permease [Roseivirga sp. 4D4]
MTQSTPSPPKLLLRFFRLYCNPQLVEAIEGDLVERFEIRALKKGQKKAKQLFIKDVIQLFRPGIIRPITGAQKLNKFGMLKNNMVIAKRQLLRHKMYSTIKIGGFAIGIAVCLLITLFIKNELSYDKHIPGHENLYRVVNNYNMEGNIIRFTWFAPPFAQAIQDDFPEVTLAGRTNEGNNFGAGKNNIRIEGDMQNHYEGDFIYADQQILDLFQFKMVYGNLEEALAQPNTLVMTRKKAEKLFPGENPVGRTVYINDNTDRPYKIGGVLEDLPSTGFFQFDFLWTLTGREFWNGEQASWESQNYQVYVRLNPGTDIEALNPRLSEIGTKYILPVEKRNGNPNAEEEMKNMSFSLEPVTDIYLKSQDISDPYQKSDIKYIWIFGVIAAFILGLACINFINLSTAKSANRAKEVGLRKTIGSQKSHLITQFLTESILYSLLSFIIAIGIASVVLPYFNQLAGKALTLPWSELWFIPTMFFSSVLIGVVAGLYPAFYLSSFRPAAVLKGKLSMGSKSSKLRNALVVFQFTASIVLIIGTFVVYQQMEYILNAQTGFNKEQVIQLRNTQVIGDQPDNFKNELLKTPEISSVTISDYLPISGTARNGNMWWKDGRTKVDAGSSGQNWEIDYDYLKTLGMNLLQGRNFDREMRTDTSAIIINEKMAEALGIQDNPIGAKITNRSSNRVVWTVIGLVEDFNFDLLTAPVRPLAMRLGNAPSTTSILVNTQDMAATIGDIQKVWEEMAPNQPFIYEFMDQNFAQMYVGVERIRNILTSFAMLAIIIACLGLFGLSVFMVEQRSKEISVRLVLGAKVTQVVSMLSFNFMKPIFLALILATPIAWYMMNEWLNDFEYKISMNIQLFVFAGISALLIALITISFQSLKAAFTSPVQGLRNE